MADDFDLEIRGSWLMGNCAQEVLYSSNATLAELIYAERLEEWFTERGNHYARLVPVPGWEPPPPLPPRPQQELIERQMTLLGYDSSFSHKEFFQRYVEHSTPECKPWPWGSGTYGLAVIDGVMTNPSRAACRWKYGEPPFPKAVAAHRCRSGVRCWNWFHLSWKSQQENIRDDTRRDGTMVVGQDRWNSKLTDAQVTSIRARAAVGVGHGELANQYGLSRKYVSDLVERKYWRHLP